MKTVIVTGGLGFIGSNLIKILNKKKYFVINIDKVTYAANFKNIPINIKNYKFYKQDINNKNFGCDHYLSQQIKSFLFEE